MLCVAWLFASTNRKLNKRYTVGASWLAIPGDSASLARGRHLVKAVAKCMDCHGENLGGTMFIDSKAFGRIPAPNITRGRGGAGLRYTDEELARVIQHGVKRDGRGVIIMPSDAYVHFGNEDLAAIVAYVRSVPPVDSAWPAPELGFVARMLLATGAPVLPAAIIDHERRNVLPVPKPDTGAAYGRYLVTVGGCPSCHNPSLSGGSTGEPGAPASANLTPTGFGNHTEADFMRVLRTGQALDGHTIDNRYMPWKSAGEMTDAEIHAVWEYLRTLPPKEHGKP